MRVCNGKLYDLFWVVISCQGAMVLGTLFGGWRIVQTMGWKITIAAGGAAAASVFI